jgi:putative membrane protein
VTDAFTYQLGSLFVPLAVDHHDWGEGWWVVMAVGMVVFWALVIAGAVWLVREFRGSGSRGPERSEALSILDRRLAEGEISPEEYRERRDAMADGGGPGG